MIADRKNNSLSFKYKNLWEDTVDLNSDIGHKFRMVVAESNFKKIKGEKMKDNNGKEMQQKEKIESASLYELYIISASIDNRKKVKSFPNTYKGVVEQYAGTKLEQYNGVRLTVYKNLLATLNTTWWAGKNWYGEPLVMQYLGRVYQAVMHKPESEYCAVSVLKSHYDLKDADYILFYTHGGDAGLGQYGFPIEFDKTKTKLKTVESSINSFPELKSRKP